MHTLTALTSLFSFISLTLSAATPAHLAPRCGTTLYPTISQFIDEANPSSVSLNSAFTASQSITSSGAATDRVNTLLGFPSIPPSSYGCTLNVYLPPNVTISSSGTPTLNISTIYTDMPNAITSPNSWSWNSIVGTQGVIGSGLFGTVNVQEGIRTTVNSLACPVGGGGLGFVVGVAGWISGAASVGFQQGNGVGFYLTYNC